MEKAGWPPLASTIGMNITIQALACNASASSLSTRGWKNCRMVAVRNAAPRSIISHTPRFHESVARVASDAAPPGDASKVEAVLRRKIQAPVAALASEERNQVETEYGYGWCDERWLGVLENDLDGGVVAEILAGNNCANLGKVVVDLSHSADPEVRARTAIIIGSIEVPDAARHLVRLIDDADEGVVRMALRSLCRIDPVSCRAEAERILILDKRPSVRRAAEVVRSDLDIGKFDKCRKYELRVAPERKLYSSGEDLTGTVSIVNGCPDAIKVAKPLLPSVWRVRVEDGGAEGEAKQVWQGMAPDAEATGDERERIPANEYQVIEGGESFGKKVDFREYLERAGVPIQETSYGVRFWYKHEPLEEEGDPLLAHEVLVSDEVRICIVGPSVERQVRREKVR